MTKSHQLEVRVYFEDTDAEGVVYYASYLRFAERARTEMMREAGFEHAQIFKETGVCFTVVSVQIDYNAPAGLDDLLTVRTKITGLGGASMEMQQDIVNGDKLIVKMKVKLVCVDSTFKAVRLPVKIREIFEGI